MRRIFQITLRTAILAPILLEPARAQGGVVYLATYVEVMPVKRLIDMDDAVDMPGRVHR
jgi:hypothetical protein